MPLTRKDRAIDFVLPFNKNIGIKVVAVFLALFLWLNVAMQKDYIATFTLPIALVNVPDALVPSQPFPTEARVRVTGTGKQLVGLRMFNHPRIMVDVFGVHAGKRVLVINNSDVFLGGADVRVVAIDEPQTLTVEFDRVGSKNAYVRSLARFEARKGHVLVGSTYITPGQVTVKGPVQNVLRVDTVFTAEMFLEDLDRDTAVSVPILTPKLFNVVCLAREVTVGVEVQKIIQRDLKSIPVQLINVPANVRAVLDTSKVSLTIVGGEQVVNSFTPNDLNVYIDFRRFLTDSIKRVVPTVLNFKEVEVINLLPKDIGLVDRPAPRMASDSSPSTAKRPR